VRHASELGRVAGKRSLRSALLNADGWVCGCWAGGRELTLAHRDPVEVCGVVGIPPRSRTPRPSEVRR